MLYRFMSALLRAGITFFMIAFPSSILATPEIGGFGAFVIFALLVSMIVFFEYAAESPSLIEFRYAPPYNRFRVMVFGGVSVFFVLSLNLNNQIGPIFDLANGVSKLGTMMVGHALSPVPALIEALGIQSATDQAEFARLAEGSLFIAFASTIIFSLIIWLQSWPLGDRGFNLWPNMPSFHARTGTRTEIRMVKIAALSIVMSMTLPYFFPIVLQTLKDVIGFTYDYNRHSGFWIIAIWTMIPAMALMRALALLKVAYLAQQLRSMKTASNPQ